MGCYCSLCNALLLKLYLISFIFIFQLEEFLVANREEYLRHSTLNYTMQQKKYNNCLTERMIKLAEEHGYTFDPTEVCSSFPNEREVYILHYCTSFLTHIFAIESQPNLSQFSFVTVRDRIRCYYKSYVQSMKKRGVVIGYAARKAGLVTEEELEQSAHTSGKIFIMKKW